MKKVVLIIRQGFDADYLLKKICYDNENYRLYVIEETGKIARKKKNILLL